MLECGEETLVMRRIRGADGKWTPPKLHGLHELSQPFSTPKPSGEQAARNRFAPVMKAVAFNLHLQ